MSNQGKRVTVQFGELAYSNMITVNALAELLKEKGVVSRQDVLERVKRLQDQTWKPD
jgi:DNA-binding Lrp family transcriptional regulator